MPIKLTTTTEEGKRGEKKKKSKRIYRTSQKIRIISVILESLLSESFAALGITVHLGCPRTLYWPLNLLWGLLLLSHFSPVRPIDGSPPGSPVPGILQARTLEWVAISFSNAWKWKAKAKPLSRVRLAATPGTAAYQAPPSMGIFQARVLEWGTIAFSSCGGYSDSNLVLLLCVLASNVHSYLSQCAFFYGSSQWPFICSIDRVCLVDRVDLICSVYSWWEGFGSSSLATLPLGFNCGFISTSTRGSSTGV